MAIRNFQFPGVELNQEFVQTPVTGVSTLGVVVVGQQYKLITADLDDKAKTISWDYDGTSAIVPLSKTEVIEGATVTTNLPGYIKADTEKGEEQTQSLDADWDKVKVAVKDAAFENFTVTSSSNYIKVYGGTVAINGSTETAINTLDLTDGAEKAIVPLDTTITSEGASNAFGTRVPEIGDPVIIVGGGTGSAKGIITAIKKGIYTVTTPAEQEGEEDTVEDIISTVIYAKITEGAEELGGSTVSSLKFLVAEDTVFDATVLANGTGLSITDASKKIGGKQTTSALVYGTYVISPTCRYKDTAYVNHLGQIGSVDELEDIFGTACVDNPMALALLFALYAGRENIVYFTGVATNDSDAYVKAMDFLDRFDTVYSVVPMVSSDTFDGVWILQQILTSVISASENTESKVRRSLWYGIETPVDSSSSLIADAIVSVRQSVAASYRAQAVWADGVLFNGELVPNYIVAAAPAGMRSYEPTYRPISNLSYSFFTLKNTTGMTNSDLIKLGSNGIWIIDNNYEETPSNKKQVTTAVSNNLNLDEESIVANADSIALTLCHVGEDLVGCSNISPALLKSLSDTITAIMDNYLINRTGNAYIGPQLLSWSLDSLYQHEVLRDHIYAVITCEPPKPFNRFVMTLRIV